MTDQSTGPVTGVAPQIWLLIGFMAAIELVLTAADNGMIGSSDWRMIAFSYGAFWDSLLSGTVRPMVEGQTYVMFLSHAFLHANLFHLVMNAAVLLSLGKFISDQTGPLPVILLFMISAVAGGAGFSLIAESQIPMIGASGAAFGFIGLWQYWELMARRARNLPLRPVFSTVGGLIILNVILAVALRGGLAWEAHLGGFVAGVALGPVMTAIARQHARHNLVQSQE